METKPYYTEMEKLQHRMDKLENLSKEIEHIYKIIHQISKAEQKYFYDPNPLCSNAFNNVPEKKIDLTFEEAFKEYKKGKLIKRKTWNIDNKPISYKYDYVNYYIPKFSPSDIEANDWEIVE